MCFILSHENMMGIDTSKLICPVRALTTSFFYLPWITNSDFKMNEANATKQIQQMIRFLHQEAEDKANEISISAEEEFNILKLQTVDAEKKKIRQEYERKYKQVEVQKKIEYSMQLNVSRVKVLQAQHDFVSAMKEETSKKLLQVRHNQHLAHHDNYEQLVQDLILQGLLRLKEPAVLVRCREDDLDVVNATQQLASKDYENKTNLQPADVIVEDNHHLPPTYSDQVSHGPSCSGGVVMASKDGKIVLDNTLDARLEVVFRNKLPQIRKMLYSQIIA